MAFWEIRNLKANKKGIQEFFGVSEIFSTVLANRNLLTKRYLETYLKSDLDQLHDIMKMKDVKKAFDLLKKGIEKNLKICIYGDYDVDGVTSTVILYKGLKQLGANIFYYIPDREEEGYGLNVTSINKLKKEGTDIIFTCDNGIASIEEVELIKSLGIDIIILDHHEPRFQEDEDGKRQDIIPKADAIIDPKQSKCPYPFKYLCTGGLSYKFIKQFYEFCKEILENEDELLVFASIATICDIVDLVDENRIITKAGLKILNNNKNINLGLYQLIKLIQLEGKELDEFTYGFIIGPCINASGRLKTALKAVELFTTYDEKTSFLLAQELVQLNNERKEITSFSVDKIINKIQNSDLKNDKILVIYEPEVPESIAGIVAGRIKEIFFKPTIIITKGKEFAKGSGRSIPAYNIFEAMLKTNDIFEKFGGHSMAVGLSIKEENIEILRQFLNNTNTLTQKDMTEVITIDEEIKFKNINFELANELLLMKPTGKENRGAIFATKNIKINRINFVGKTKEVLQMQLIDSCGVTVDSVSFSLYEKLKQILEDNLEKEENEKIFSGDQKYIDLNFDVVYSIEVKKFNNLQNIQLHIKDLRLS